MSSSVYPSVNVSSSPQSRQISTYLGSDKLQTRELPPGLLLDQGVDLWVSILEGGVKVLVL
jgi:hypothetical protein